MKTWWWCQEKEGGIKKTVSLREKKNPTKKGNRSSIMTGKDQCEELYLESPAFSFQIAKQGGNKVFLMFTDAYMLPVDKCIGHKHTKWQPAQSYRFSSSGSVMKALLSRVPRELCACLARKRYTRRSNPPPHLWSTEIQGSVLPFPGQDGEEILQPPRGGSVLPAALRPQAAALALPPAPSSR